MEQKNILSVFYVVSAADMLDYILMEKMDLDLDLNANPIYYYSFFISKNHQTKLKYSMYLG